MSIKAKIINPEQALLSKELTLRKKKSHLAKLGVHMLREGKILGEMR